MSEEEIKDMALKFQSALLESSYQINQKLQQENSQLKEDIKGFEQERQTLYNTIHDLQKANKQLNRKIEKAIKYIQDNKLNTNKISEMLCGSEVMTLLEILEGDE